MPTYEAYKDSGVEWLGEVPSEWPVLKMRYLYRDTSIKNRPNETLLSVTQDKGVVPRDWVENRMVMPSGNLESFKFIEEGDFAISLRSFEGGLEYCHHAGIISPAYTVLKSIKNGLTKGYYKYLFKSQAFISELQTSIVGIREGKNISYEELKYSYLPIPSSDQQTLIANFLDQKTAQIDEAIAIKEQQIALLKERKQIIIQKAVTQGLDPDVPMKDSGVDWIGEIPAHWNLKSLKFYIEKIIDNRGRTPAFGDYGIPMLEVKNITEGNHQPTEVFSKFVNPKLVKSYERDNVEIGDILISTVGATSGKAVIIQKTPNYFICQNVVGIRMVSEVNRLFASYALASSYFKTSLMLINKGNTIDNLKVSVFINNPLLLPPEEEQEAISLYIDNALKENDIGIEHLHLQITKLKEYKTTLINSAVTGKIRITPEMVA